MDEAVAFAGWRKATLAQSELGEAAAKLLQTANGRPVMVTGGGRQVGVLVSMDYIARVRKMDIARMNEIARKAGAKLDAHAEELSITTDALLERLLNDSDDI